MTAELVRGQNHALPGTDLTVRVEAALPVLAGMTLADADGRGREGWLVHGDALSLPGLLAPGRPAPAHDLRVDLARLPEGARTVRVWLALPSAGPASFAAAGAPRVVVGEAAGAARLAHTLGGLAAESAVTAVEFYRRAGAWKVRAVGQGYAGGLAALCADHGLPDAATLARRVLASSAAGTRESAPPPQEEPAPQPGRVDYRHPGRAGRVGPAVDVTHPGRPARPEPRPSSGEPAAPPPPVAGDASGWSMEERLHNQVWGMFEDLARAVAAYRGAVSFADDRLEREIDGVLADPRTRTGPAADRARERARSRQGELIARARAALDRDLDQLTAEAAVVEPALPPAFARWDNPVWHGYRVPEQAPLALRLGDLSLPERIGLRIPMLVRLPLERGLWIDAGRGDGPATTVLDGGELRREAGLLATAVAGRLLAVHPPGRFTVRVIDPAGSAAHTLRPLVDSGVLAEPPARGAAGVAAVLERLTERVDLVQMAVRSGAADALPPGLDTSEQLLVVHDFPHGFDDRAVTRLRYLADEGPSVGVHLLMVADREDAAAYGPLLDPLWRSLLRITPVPDDHIADPWVRQVWTYEPPHVPPGSAILPQVLGALAAARARLGGR
ncbi:TerD family protein [Streptomyces chumphonensis]|uniref:TerD family protein n=1 Tax=Streptomyces chumphonensis TaxID=1214925 RepID=A0A927EVP5_9ACTN|nr:TerD family protein [Streptomyces chumphonensis]MBD3930110.1 TerD family protein [Streptomyces chumphonensis]